MKKLTLFAVLAVAAVAAALSCAKQDAGVAGTGEPITIEVGAPVIEADPATSVDLTNNTAPYTVAWVPGDQIQIFNHTVKESGYNEWPLFTTAAGGATASFSGTPGGSDKHEYVAFSMYQDGHEATLSASASSTVLNYYIPAQQDGTGAKYALYATRRVTYSGGTLSISGMALRSALTRFTIAGTAVVKRVTVTVNYTDDKGADVNVVSAGCGLCTGTEGAKQMSVFSFKNADDYSFTQGVGGTGTTITIENGGARLTGDIYFASRHTLKTYAKCTLTFVFTDEEDKTCTKTVTLYEKEENNFQIVNGQMNKLGTVTLNTGDFS